MVALCGRVNDILMVFAQVVIFDNGLKRVSVTILARGFRLDREPLRCINLYDDDNELFQIIRWVQR